MPFNPDRSIAIEIMVKAAQPGLLEGLDAWLQLGLISDEQVRQLCREHLICPLARSPAAATSPIQPELPRSEPGDGATEPVLEPVYDFVTAETSTKTQPRSPDRGVSRLLQSLMAEMSVLWLLLLGVFLVVVSSGVLAASQWQNVSPIGQYSILFAYTLVFWGASAWTGRQPNLQLTARMLQAATVLIIPVNFWMMDGFLLQRGSGNAVVVVIAAIVLNLIHVLLLRSPAATPSFLTIRWVSANSILLNLLQLGWRASPLLPTYVGAVATAFLLFYQVERSNHRNRNQPDDTAPSPAAPAAPTPLTPSLALISLLFGVLLLIVRAVFVTGVAVSQLGLAIGIWGWLLCWFDRRDRGRFGWQRAGIALLLLGWLVAVPTVPWQAIGISGLGLWLLTDRVQRLARLEDTTALFLVGLQTVWLVWRVIPDAVQQWLIASSIQVAGETAMPEALIGLGVFPYVVLTVFVAFRLRRLQPILANHLDLLALLLGVMLTAISVGNPLVRSLNLFLSFLVLAWVTRDRTNAPPGLIYLTHLTGAAAVISGIDAQFPDLDRVVWAGILLVAMLAEWGFSATPERRIWRESAWYLGVGLAALSYSLLLNRSLEDSTHWTGIWLITPVALTLLANSPNALHPRVTTGLSVASLVLLQPLMLSSGISRLLGWGAATQLMVLNTRQWQTWLNAALTIGFGLGFAAVAVWEIRSGDVSPELAMNLFAIAALLLWVMQSQLARREVRLFKLYAGAADGWAVAIATLSLLLLTLYMVVIYSSVEPVQWAFVLAAAVTLIAISYRNWQQFDDLNFYGIAWSLELTVVGLVALAGRSWDALAIANLALGLFTQLLGAWYLARQPDAAPQVPTRFSSLHTVPLVYALFGLILQHREFTAYTGLYTLAAALVGIGVGRRFATFKPLTYLAMLGVSIAAYELLLYQLFQAKEGRAGDGIVLLAALAAALAIALRLLSRWLAPYLRLERSELASIAHLHWFAGSGLLVWAIFNSLSDRGEWFWVGITATLACYALANGRRQGMLPSASAIADSHPPSHSPEVSWTYAGILEALIALFYLLHLWVPDRIFLGWAAAIACVIAYAMYSLPWESWGWSASPWQQSANILPAAVVTLTGWAIELQSLLIAAAFYAWLARVSRQTRLSYLSILLADWAIIRLMLTYNITEPLWYSTLLGASLLYVAQVDPELRSPNERERRHLLRCLAVGLVCLTALYQSDNSWLLSLFTLVLSIGLVVAGLALRTRAFLYVGTATFVIKVLRQIWVFISDYSLVLWAVGIVLGLLFIWVAATFESRRSQMVALLQYWVGELQTWE